MMIAAMRRTMGVGGREGRVAMDDRWADLGPEGDGCLISGGRDGTVPKVALC